MSGLRAKLVLLSAPFAVALLTGLAIALADLDDWRAATAALAHAQERGLVTGRLHTALTRAMGEAASYVLTNHPRYRAEATEALESATSLLEKLAAPEAVRPGADDRRADAALVSTLERVRKLSNEIRRGIEDSMREADRDHDPWGADVLLRRIYHHEDGLAMLAGMLAREHERVSESARARAAEYLERLRRWGLLVVVGAVGWVLALLVFLNREVVRPATTLRRSLAGVAAGDLEHGLAIRTRDEFGDLQESFNRMIEALAAQRATLTERSTELERTVATLTEARWQAEAGVRAKEQFLATMSHELRTPLTTMIGAAELLELTSLDDDQRRSLRMLRSAGERLDTMLTELLELSNLDAGRMQLERSAFDPGVVVTELFEDMRQRADAKGLHWRVVFDPPLSPRLYGDAARFRQVLRHLLENALKFTSEGGVTLTVRDTPSLDGAEVQPDQADDRRWLRCEVRDTGIGIGATDIDRIFEPFAQVDASSSRRYAGAGLGLAVVQRWIGRMGGTIQCVSAPGVGATFSVVLPFERSASAGADGNDVALPVPHGTLPVLVVEDEPVHRELVRAFLDRLGLQHVAAIEGAEAVELARTQRYGLILMDCRMPGVDGYEATRRIRALEGEHGNVPIVALTASIAAGSREACLAAGMNDMLHKPIRPAELQRVMANWYRDGAQGSG